MTKQRSKRSPNQLDLARLAEVMVRLEQGEQVPIDRSWVDHGIPPLSRAQRGQLKGTYDRLRRLQPPLHCMAPVHPPCAAVPIDSHSMQRRGPLAVLAEDAHVLTFRYSQSIVERASTYLERTPATRASTFPGLCALHDERLFDPIDRPLTAPDSEQVFLLAYRGMLREVYVARQLIRHRQALLDDLLESSDPSQPGVLEIFVASLLRIEMALPRLVHLAGVFGDWYRERRHGELASIVIRGLPVVPFAVSDYFEPHHDHEGRSIVGDGNPSPFVILNVVPTRGGTTVTLSFLEEHRASLRPFLEPFAASTEQRGLIDLLWLTTLRWSDNIAVAPAAWRLIPERRQARILKFADDTRDSAFVPMLPGNVTLQGDGWPPAELLEPSPALGE